MNRLVEGLGIELTPVYAQSAAQRLADRSYRGDRSSMVRVGVLLAELHAWAPMNLWQLPPDEHASTVIETGEGHERERAKGCVEDGFIGCAKRRERQQPAKRRRIDAGYWGDGDPHRWRRWWRWAPSGRLIR
jgi:hypothetical protein